MNVDRMRSIVMATLHCLLVVVCCLASAHRAAGNLYGVAYTPFRIFERCPSDVEVESDVQMILRHSRKARIYSTECMNVMDIMLRHASNGDLSVLLGVWIDNRATDQKEIDDLILALDRYPNADIYGIVVGNEPLFRNTMTPTEVAGRVAEVRHKVRELGSVHNSHVLQTTPIFSVDVFPHPQVVAVSDVVGSNIHPFYRRDLPKLSDPEVLAEMAVQKTFEQHQLFQQMYGKKVIITEVGWPTSSSPSDVHIGSKDISKAFLEKWVDFAGAQNLEYFWFELFDSRWKQSMFPDEPSTMSEFNWGMYLDDHHTDKGVI